jgi:hypothetical protein
MKRYTQFLVCATFLLAPLVFAQLPEPVGHWPFDEGSGYVTADVSGNANDGVIWTDGVSWSTDTPTGTGYSLEFAGKLGAVQIGDPDILKIVGDITLAAWVKTGPATESWQNIIVKGHGQAAGEIVMRVDGQTGKHDGTQIWCGSYDGNDHMVQSYTLSDLEFNTWIHVVGVYSTANQTWYLYFNGDEVNELVDPVGAVSVDRGWAIGARALAPDGTYPSERYFEGLIDDVRIYDVALTEDDVKALYKESSTPVAVKNQSTTVPAKFALGQNYPNPFNPQTRIDYQVPQAANVNISVYSIMGQLVTTLVDEAKNPGYYSVDWNARDQNGLRVSSGVYLARMVSNNYSATRKLILLK